MNKRLSVISILLAISMLTVSGISYGWRSTGGDGTDYGAIQETAVMYNWDAAGIGSYRAVILQVASTASSPTAGDELGAYIQTTVTADHARVVGVTKDGISTAGPVEVVTKGPAKVYAMDSTDAFAEGEAVGTTGTKPGYIGKWVGGSSSSSGKLGHALEAGDGTDTGTVWIWVDPQ